MSLTLLHIHATTWSQLGAGFGRYSSRFAKLGSPGAVVWHATNREIPYKTHITNQQIIGAGMGLLKRLDSGHSSVCARCQFQYKQVAV